MDNKLKELLLKNIITEMNLRFAEFISQLSENKNEIFFRLMVLISRWTENGHICLNLDNLKTDEVREIMPDFNFPSLKAIKEILANSPCIGRPGDAAPLILKHNNLYFERFYNDEKVFLQNIKNRINKDFKPPENSEEVVSGILHKLFPIKDSINWQAAAAINALLKYFSVISGGPGTGKTTTVIKIIIFLIELCNKGFIYKTKKSINIVLSAPTGKAAVRLFESLEYYKNNSKLSKEVLLSLPKEGFTIHRLIKQLSRKNSLPPDIIIIDEASMADISILSALFALIPETTRIILIGDKDQLASVEAGSVLGDICSGIEKYDFTGDFYNILERFFKIKLNGKENNPPAVRDSIVLLNKNYRFKGVLTELSNAVNKGDSLNLINILNKSSDDETDWINPEIDINYRNKLQEYLLQLYALYINEKDIEKAYNIFNSFRVICALRKGSFGVESTNRWIENMLKINGLINPYKEFYNNRPILITKNDYNTGLFNGDTGLIRKGQDNNIYIYFKDTEGNFKRFSPYRLPQYETMYCMTVHKSQGSEFDKVILVLPDTPNPVVTRELIYTGITRTKSRLHIIAREEILKEGISKTIKRTSGINKSLWEYKK